MKVLDFGAGTGWTSRFLSQLGCEVIVSDVSQTALDLAAEGYERLPVIGPKPEPTFLRFDGRRIGLEDNSVDRILCFDALHHTVNPNEVLAEMARVLRPGGIAAFSEPGPNHSKGAQSQYEMKNYTVIENDILIRDIESSALGAGFDRLELAVFTTQPFHLSADGYERLLARRSEAYNYLSHHREFLNTRRVFFLHAQGSERRDSRRRDGLHADLWVTLEEGEFRSSMPIEFEFRAENSGLNWWLAGDAPIGPVVLGVHLYGEGGTLIDRDFCRIDLGCPEGVPPGGVAVGSGRLPTLASGSYVVEFDLVAEGVAWFEINGSVPSRHHVTVV
jgi:SAM-dependent methyltransferase